MTKHDDEHAELDRMHHDIVAPKYDELIVDPRQTLNDVIFKRVAKRLPARGRSMLDLGAGTGHMAMRFGRGYDRVMLVDHSRGMLEQARRNTAGVKSDLRFEVTDALGFVGKCDDRFDLITCVGFLHHLRADQLQFVFSNLMRLLEPDGRILLAEPVATPRTEPKAIQWWNRASLPKFEQYVQLAPMPDEAPLNLQLLKDVYAEFGFATAYERRGWEVFSHFGGNSIDKLVIPVLDFLFGAEGVVWVGLLEKTVKPSGGPQSFLQT
nr:class I SAM-dependent methyltransferase [Zoogloeaceae bacterium]